MKDHFNLIQHFFTRLRCHACHEHFEPNGIELVRQEHGLYLVNVHCCHCGHNAGVAMVGVEQEHAAPTLDPRYQDPELTPVELERLQHFDPITDEDVLDAHQFFKSLDEGWLKHVPEEMRQSLAAPQTQSPSQPA